MKKVLLILALFISANLFAQTIPLAGNTWNVAFSQEFKNAILTLGRQGDNVDYRFSFPAVGAKMIQSNRYNAQKVEWKYSFNGTPNSFTVSKGDLLWIFTFDVQKGSRYFYKMSLKYLYDNQFATLFSTPGLKNRYFQKNGTTIPGQGQQGYTLSKSGAFYFQGPLSEGDDYTTVVSGLYALVGTKIYCLPLKISGDNNFNYAYYGAGSYDGDFVFGNPAKIMSLTAVPFIER